MRGQPLASRSLRRGSSMQRARSVTGPLRRAHPASGATWNVQVVRGKMSSQCLWHACRALSAGLLLMLLGSAMAVIGYYADFLSVDQEIRGNATVSVKDEARGFHLNNLSYVGPIVMGFGGFIVVAACVMTFEARDSAAKVTPARPSALPMPRPLPRRGPAPACAAPARLDTLGVYRLPPHVLPLPHSLPLVPLHRHHPVHVRITGEREKLKGKARFGSAPDLRSGSVRATLPVAALRRPLRRYALSVDEPPQSAVSASAAESECGSQSSLALDLHASGACAGVTLRVRDNTRRRPLARQQRLQDDTQLATPRGSTCHISNAEEAARTPGATPTIDTTRLSVESELRASSAPPPTRISAQPSPLPSPILAIVSPLEPEHSYITIEQAEQQMNKPEKQEMEKQTNALKGKIGDEICALPREDLLNFDVGEPMAPNDNMDRIVEEDMERQPQLQIHIRTLGPLQIIGIANQTDGGDGGAEPNAAMLAQVTQAQAIGEAAAIRNREHGLAILRMLSTPAEVTGYPPQIELNTSEEFTLERLQEELEIDVVSLLAFHRPTPMESMHMQQEAERQLEDGAYEQYVEQHTLQATERQWEEETEQQSVEATEEQHVGATDRQPEEITESQSEAARDLLN